MLTKDQELNLIKTAKAKNPRLTFEETKSLLERANTIASAPKPSFLSELGTSLAKPFVQTGKNIGSAAFETKRAVATALGSKDEYVNTQTGQDVSNPFMSNEELSKFSGTTQQKLGAVYEQGIKPAAGVMAWAVPFGKGTSLLSRAALPGAVSGGLSALSSTREGAGVGETSANIGVGAGVGAVTSTLLTAGIDRLRKMGSKQVVDEIVSQPPKSMNEAITRAQGADDVQSIIDKATRGADKTKQLERPSVKTWLSSFKLPSKKFNELKPYETANKMLEWNIDGTSDMLNAKVDTVTGPSGVMTTIKNSAIGRIKGEIPMPDVVKQAKDLIAADTFDPTNPAMKDFFNRVLSTQKATGKAVGTMDPSMAADFANQFKERGFNYLWAGKNPLTPRPELVSLGKKYIEVGNMFDDAVMNAVQQQGTLSEYIGNTQLVKFLSSRVSPEFGKAFSSAKTVPELRSLAAPFVNLGKMIDFTQRYEHGLFGSLIKSADNWSLTNFPIKAAQTAANSRFVSTTLAPLLDKVVAKTPNMSVKELLSKLGAITTGSASTVGRQ